MPFLSINREETHLCISTAFPPQLIQLKQPIFILVCFLLFKPTMAATTYTQEVECATAPARLFKALCLDNHNVFPKVLPDRFKSVELVQGDRNAVGSVTKICFPEGHPYKYAKHRIDELDEASFYCKYTTIEGDVLHGKYEYVVREIKIVASGTGSVCKLTTHFKPAAGATLNEEGIKVGQEKVKEMTKIVDEYLVANPQAYA